MSARLARVLFACVFQHTSRRRSGSSRRMQKHPRTYTQYGGRSYFHLMLHSVAAHGVVCVYVVETSEMERVRAFVSFTLPVLLWGTACLSLPEDLTFKQMEWTAPCLQLKPEGPSLLCTQ